MSVRPCASCEMLTINGLACHEQGCPDAWRTERPECRWCGQDFTREYRGEVYCSTCCAAADNGEQCDCESCESFRAELASEVSRG